ncbi:hypothetical protein CEXT_121271 [Caerostris extrusa]|uniref:Uncharacterized protein n=1 Tax=Caerostris extrusa TaxID=172846 RepID=A0AAV4P5Y0_CAEEX|nr:hypothetical protein CEXT_121271 [Caerostris extrusa]
MQRGVEKMSLESSPKTARIMLSGNIRWYVNIESMLSELKIVLMENKISMEFAECLLTISKDLFQKEEHGMERVTHRDNADA